MKRREFITVLGGAAAWPLAGRAQQREGMRRVGVLINLPENDPEGIARLSAFRKALQELGWIEGQSLRIETRWGVDNEHIRKNAAELVSLASDVILANAPPSVLALQQVTQSLPIVFVNVTDPVSMGIVQSLARPGGNATGFTAAEFAVSAKWLELLKEIAPGVKRAAVLRELSNPSALPQFVAIQAMAPSLGVEVSPLGARNAADIERGISAFAKVTNSGLIVTRTSETISHRDVIVEMAARHRLPAVYPQRFFVTGGGLIAYGFDTIDQYRRAAHYVDRVLKGEKPADLAVQEPVKFNLVINLKTAKTLGFEIPPTLLARADEVIE